MKNGKDVDDGRKQLVINLATGDITENQFVQGIRDLVHEKQIDGVKNLDMALYTGDITKGQFEKSVRGLITDTESMFNHEMNESRRDLVVVHVTGDITEDQFIHGICSLNAAIKEILEQRRQRGQTSFSSKNAKRYVDELNKHTPLEQKMVEKISSLREEMNNLTGSYGEIVESKRFKAISDEIEYIESCLSFYAEERAAPLHPRRIC